ncbi:uncharacterized protein LOC117178734 [Belonocnema kinseyi]|uniref:uncharacterized protein LOC117178734 n=1 Tax=Belonocnema kinseyi TaxID=2817044 RepID=UPI00143CE38A|nr:uncharacterized protein LOC117178734 [Belonocnema kinseyi]
MDREIENQRKELEGLERDRERLELNRLEREETLRKEKDRIEKERAERARINREKLRIEIERQDKENAKISVKTFGIKSFMENNIEFWSERRLFENTPQIPALLYHAEENKNKSENKKDEKGQKNHDAISGYKKSRDNKKGETSPSAQDFVDPNLGNQIMEALQKLLKKEVKWEWFDKQEQAFTTIKHLLMTAPILASPDFGSRFQLETDASDIGLGAVLTQTINGENYVIAFASRGRLARWALELLEYDYEIVYRKGSLNQVQMLYQGQIKMDPSWILKSKDCLLSLVGEELLTHSCKKWLIFFNHQQQRQQRGKCTENGLPTMQEIIKGLKEKKQKARKIWEGDGKKKKRRKSTDREIKQKGRTGEESNKKKGIKKKALKKAEENKQLFIHITEITYKKMMEEIKVWQCRHCDTYCGQMSNRTKNHHTVPDSTRTKYIKGGWAEANQKFKEMIKIFLRKEEWTELKNRQTTQKIQDKKNNEEDDDYIHLNLTEEESCLTLNNEIEKTEELLK